MNYDIQFKDTTFKSLGYASQDIIPRKGEKVYIDHSIYVVENVIWSYSDPHETYPEDPLTFEDVTVILSWIVTDPKIRKASK